MEHWNTDQTTATRIALIEHKIEDIAANIKEIKEQQAQAHTAMMTKLDNVEKRVQVVERWRWMMIGASMVGGYLLAHLRLFDYIK
jgi:outer membrane murein-binding lipoprotein Lpp